MPKTSIELASQFLNGRKSAWLSAGQTKWLTDVIARERNDQTRHRSYFLNTDQINNDPSGTRGLHVYHRKNRDTSKLIARGVDEGNLEQILNDRQWTQYESGKWAFKVSAQSLCEVFQWLP